MCRLQGTACECERRMASVYHRRRVAGASQRAAFMAAVGEFRRLHPDASAWCALAAAKEVLSSEPDPGIVDCAAKTTLASKTRAGRIASAG